MSEDTLSLRKWAYDRTNSIEEAQKLFDWITQDEVKLFENNIQPKTNHYTVKWTDEADSFLRNSFANNDSMQKVRKNLASMGINASSHSVNYHCKKLGIVHKTSSAKIDSSRKNASLAREALGEKKQEPA